MSKDVMVQIGKRVLVVGCVLILALIFSRMFEDVHVNMDPLLTSTPSRMPTPSVDPTPCSDDSCLDECFFRLAYEMNIQTIQPPSTFSGKKDNYTLVSYLVRGGQLGVPKYLDVPEEYQEYQQDLDAQKRIWDFAITLIPEDLVKRIRYYHVFTDGLNNVAAWVNNDPADRDAWILGIDIVDTDNMAILAYLLIHEISHIINLSTDQIPKSSLDYGWYQNPYICQQFMDPYGCTTPDSYENLYYQKFWKDIFQEWQELANSSHVNSEKENAGIVDEFYVRHKDTFIRQYSATNIREDMADSFTQFVLSHKPRETDVIGQKIQFFYDFPELVQVRERMLLGICNYKAGK